jgi:glycine oxidase
VAAGMLAPLMESLLDPVSAGHYPFLLQARDAWPAMLEAVPIALDRSGALLKAPSQEAAGLLLAKAAALGAHLGAAVAPQGVAAGAWLFTPEDWRLEPRAALSALHGAFERLDGRRLAAAAVAFDQGLVRFDTARSWPADAVVLATGPSAGAWPLAGADAHLSPIKGQILRFPGQGPASGPVVRANGVYIAPSCDGVVVGATMEEGRSDLTVDPQAVARLKAAAAGLYPHLADAHATASAGVRVSTPDGLPLVGPCRQAGVLLARGARRNGWLLAPLISEVLIDHLLERPAGAAANAFDPGRFG